MQLLYSIRSDRMLMEQLSHNLQARTRERIARGVEVRKNR